MQASNQRNTSPRSMTWSTFRSGLAPGTTVLPEIFQIETASSEGSTSATRRSMSATDMARNLGASLLPARARRLGQITRSGRSTDVSDSQAVRTCLAATTWRLQTRATVVPGGRFSNESIDPSGRITAQSRRRRRRISSTLTMPDRVDTCHQRPPFKPGVGVDAGDRPIVRHGRWTGIESFAEISPGVFYVMPWIPALAGTKHVGTGLMPVGMRPSQAIASSSGVSIVEAGVIRVSGSGVSNPSSALASRRARWAMCARSAGVIVW